MLAQDVMTKDVCTVGVDASVNEIARLLIDRGISAVVVTDSDERILGLVSEGDLIRRCESETDRRRSKWRELVADRDVMAKDYRRSHALTAHSIMSRHIVCVAEDTPLGKIADIFEAKAIKRVPVARDGKLVGIVSRRDLVRAFTSQASAHAAPAGDATDDAIRREVEKRMRSEPWAESLYLQTMVNDGVVSFHGFARSEEHKRALVSLAESVSGVKRVDSSVQIGSPPIAAV